uniref:recombination mediator RecR n=2 Tax=Candidatus Neptunichlamydia sp. REUL1 TaxID=3064277 RepID=UPI002931573D|nr:recombination mediator RecR [Candidatus Neptunochlamydia sp. REUL1]
MFKSMLRYPKDLLTLIAYLRKLPGVGKKTAERYAFHLLEWEGKDLHEFADGVATLKERVQACAECGCLMDGVRCSFCDHERRDRNQLCIIATPRDTYSIEETGNYRGLYHVLGALLSPLDGKTPENLNLPQLQKRIEGLGTKEIILALDSTLEGDATSLYLKEQFEKYGIEVSRLALGLPIGSSLDFVDEGTLSQAFSGRQKF